VKALRQRRLLWIAGVAIPLLFAAVAFVQSRIDKQTRAASLQDELVLQSPSLVRTMSLGYDSLVADIYWTRAVQYFGGRVGKPGAKFDLLWPLLDITTTLDPKMIVAYRFGAVFLSEPVVGANRPDLAAELVKRGIAANPGEWRLNSDLGFLYYWQMRDYQASSAAYLAGSKNPKAPPWLKMMAARIAQKGGSIETSRLIWAELYDSTHDPAVRQKALEMIRGLKAEEDEMQLNELAEQYKEKTGRYPVSTAELRDAGMLGGFPADPEGYPYKFGADGRSMLDPKSPVIIPKEPRTPPVVK